MATLPILQLSQAGVDISTLGSPTGPDDFVNDGKTLILVTNADGTNTEVTFDSITNCDQGFDHNIVVDVPAGDTYAIGMFTVKRFGSSVAVSYEKTTSLTISPLRT